MSSHLVKKLLRVSATTSGEAAEHDNRTERPLKRRRKETSSAGAMAAPASKEEIVASRVRQMLAMDKSVTTKEGSKKSLRKISHQQNEMKARKRKASQIIVTNSRSAPAQGAKKHEPTVDKKRMKKEREEAQLKKIAEKLKQFTNAKKRK